MCRRSLSLCISCKVLIFWEFCVGGCSAIAHMDSPPPPHLVMLPFPAQGHVSPMFMLAQLLHRAASFTISFVNTHHTHRRIGPSASAVPGIEFLSIPDGLPPDHPRTGFSVVELLFSMPKISKPAFKNLIGSLRRAPACIICDGILPFAIDVAAELGIPAIAFRTYSATSAWIYFHIQRLVEAGDVPIAQGSDEDMDTLISCKIPGVENIVRRRDLPVFCRRGPDYSILQFFINQSSKMREASALILNSFEELEAPIISHIRSIYPSVYVIGPLHIASKPTPLNNNNNAKQPHSSSSLIQTADMSWLEWLDSQQPKSVLYVSFGSVAELTRDQLIEFLYGLVDSGAKFLWAMRPDLLAAGGLQDFPNDLKMCAEERGMITGWVPQEEVLGHDAVGGFLTHSGWNSTLESMSAGKPMLCWPCVAEQPLNSRWVEEIWRVGIRMEDICDRSTVEKMVRDLMQGRRPEIRESVDRIARLAHDSVGDGGSSHRNLRKLIEDIKLLQHSTKK